MSVIDAAVAQVSGLRGRIGNFQRNVLETNIRTLGVAQENLTATESDIRDVDFAAEMTNFTKLQILLDRAGASPGVIDGFDGDNVRKAVAAFEAMRGFEVDGIIDAEVVAALDVSTPVIGDYVVTAEAVAAIVSENGGRC